MLRWASDADVSGKLLRALLRREPSLDLVRAQDAGFRTADDPSILDWAATEGRILISHDRSTMTAFANARIQAGQPMTGLVVISMRLGYRRIISDIFLADFCSPQDERNDKVLFLPL